MSQTPSLIHTLPARSVTDEGEPTFANLMSRFIATLSPSEIRAIARTELPAMVQQAFLGGVADLSVSLAHEVMRIIEDRDQRLEIEEATRDVGA